MKKQFLKETALNSPSMKEYREELLRRWLLLPEELLRRWLLLPDVEKNSFILLPQQFHCICQKIDQ